MNSIVKVADAFDLGGFLLLAWFNGFVASRQQNEISAWLAPFQVMAALIMLSMTTLTTAFLKTG